jgi:hypothetical protein
MQDHHPPPFNITVTTVLSFRRQSSISPELVGTKHRSHTTIYLSDDELDQGYFEIFEE